MNLEFKLKCVVRLPGYSAGTFSGYCICLDPPLVVDSSSMLYLVARLCTPALANAKRQLLLTECAVRFLDFASDVLSPAELSTHLPNFRSAMLRV